MKKGLDPTSRVSKEHLPEVCAVCHGAIAVEYAGGIHAEALRKGSHDAPVCTDCHGEHSIFEHTDPRSRVAAANVSAEVCSPCHSSLRLTEKYGIASDRFQSFSDSYHGLAIRGGAVEVANCASCHGAHGIRPSSDPTSSVNKNNLAKTCGRCHPGANESFAIGNVHVLVEKEQEPVLYWIARLYIGLIVLVVGGMLFHNGLDLVRKTRHRLTARRWGGPARNHEQALYLRMTLNERFQHIFLLVSFVVLVITGFMLRYPDSWWVTYLRGLDDRIFDYRSLMHRVAGVVMVVASVYHLAYVILTRRGRQFVRDMLPRRSDITDVLGAFAYNLGFSSIKPRFGRFSYVEKSEYWAVVWGTVVMVVTGTIMWFENTFIGVLTLLGWEIARTIHFYEAWLAALAILVWHIYFVIFNPDVYPMNLAWITGTLSAEEMEEEHPLEMEAMRQARSEANWPGDEEGKPERELSLAGHGGGRPPGRGGGEDRSA
jgi:formate dehydrogenase gamma subunit